MLSGALESKPLSSSITFYSSTNIAHSHNTNIHPSTSPLFLCRWQIVTSTIVHLSKASTKTHTHTHTHTDPLIPSGTVEEMEEARLVLLKDLTKLENLSIEGAERVSQKITADSVKLAAALLTRLEQQAEKEKQANVNASTYPDNQANNTNITNNAPATAFNHRHRQHQGDNDLVELVRNKFDNGWQLRLNDLGMRSAYGQQQHRVYSITEKHAKKLRGMWEVSRRNVDVDANIEEGKEGREDTEGMEAAFKADLLSLLVRYEALEAKGW